ncbi:MAG: aldehyde dehydrogenase family protein, partial [Nocardioides sp.]
MSAELQLDPLAWEISHDPRTGTEADRAAVTTTHEVTRTLRAAAAASPAIEATGPSVRARWLGAVADALQDPAHLTRLVDAADRETALGGVRLRGEIARCANQLRFYADVASEGSYLGATIDLPTGGRSGANQAGPANPGLRRLRIPLGPVAVLGASNFPFAFGPVGNDTASALAAGCPVIAKAHPAHPVTSQLIAEVTIAALAEAGAPAGTFALVSGFAGGQALVRASEIAAVAFTGSQRGGMAIWRMAAERERVIPVYAEMGTVNPVIVTTAGAATRPEEIAAGFVASYTLGMGQFCTKPGLLFAPHGSDFAARVAEALRTAAPVGWLLTEQIAAAYDAGVAELVSAGATVVAQTSEAPTGWTGRPAVLAAPSAALGGRLTEECFGPVGLVVEYTSGELPDLIRELQG